MTTTEELLADGCINIGEGCRFLSCSRSTLYGLMERGELAFVKIGRSRRVPKRALLELAARHLKGGWANGEIKTAPDGEDHAGAVRNESHEKKTTE